MTEFDKIYRAYFNDVYRYILKISGDENIAEEISSETFFKAMRSLSSFHGNCEIRVWLCQIAKNCYFTYLKRKNRIVSLDDIADSDIINNTESIEDISTKKDDHIQIHKILHDLSEPYKEIFMLRVFGELSFKEIANIFSKTENWACVTYHRAKNQIINKMEVTGNEK